MATNNPFNIPSNIFPDTFPNTDESLLPVGSGINPQAVPLRVGTSGTGRTSAGRALTQKEQQALIDQQRQQVIEQMRERLNNLRDQPEWQNASSQRREEMLKSWTRDQYLPVVNQQFGQDLEMQAALRRLPEETLGRDIAAINDNTSLWNRVSDAWIGAANNVNSLVSTVTDSVPGWLQSRAINILDNAIAENRPLTYNEKLTIGDYYTRMLANGASLQDVRDYAYRELDRQVRESDESAKARQARDSGRSPLSGNQQRRREELREGTAEALEQSFLGPAAGRTIGEALGTIRGALESPQEFIQTAAEQAPYLALTAGSTAAGFAAGGPAGGTAAASLVSGALSGQDAASSAIDVVNSLSEEQLQQSPEYQRILATGATPQQARARIAYSAGRDASLYGALVGLATGPIGVEYAAGRALSGGIRPSAAGLTRAGVGRTAAAGAGRLFTEGAEEGLTQFVGNYAAKDNSGANIDLFNGVGESFGLGVVASAPISVATTGRELYTARNASTPTDRVTPTTENPTGTPPATPDTQPTPTLTGDNANQLAVTPDAASAVQGVSELVGAGANPAAAGSAAVDAARAALYTTVADIRSRAGQALTTPEVNTLFERLYAVEEAGAPVDTLVQQLNSLTTTRAAPPTMVSRSMDQAYREYVETRATQDLQQAAQEIVLNSNVVPSVETQEAINDQSGNDTSVSGVPIGDSQATTTATGSPTTTTSAATTSAAVNRDAANEQTGGTASNLPTAVVSDTEPTAAMGANTIGLRTDSRSSGELTATERTSEGASDGIPSGTAGPSSTDDRSAASPSPSSAGETRSVAIGQQVVYTPRGRGTRPISGTITRVNRDGSVNMRTRRGEIKSQLSADRITPALDATATPSVKSPQSNISQPAISQQPEVTDITPQQAAVVSKPQVVYVSTTITPSGRSITNLKQIATEYLDTEYADAATQIIDAVNGGVLVRADQIANQLYAQGVRSFATPQVSLGQAAVHIQRAYDTMLTNSDRALLQSEYARISNSLPAELNSEVAVRDSAVVDTMLQDSGVQPNTNILSKLSQAARAVIRKLVSAIAAVVAAITINTAVPINDSVAQTHGGVVTVVSQVSDSPSVNTVNSWVQETKDNQGQRYIIADKTGGMIYVMDSSGKVLSQAPALYGRKLGDGMTVGETPAGIFTITRTTAPASYGGDLQQFATAPNGDVYAIHRVLTTNPSQRRVQRLESPEASDNRISLGCINIPKQMYDEYLNSNFSGKLYIIPEQQSLGSIFNGIQETDANSDLRPGETLPMDLSRSDNQEFKSSTTTLAAEDVTIAARDPNTSPEYGAMITQEAQNMDVGTSMSGYAEATNDAQLQTMGFAGSTSIWGWGEVIRALRRRRRTKPDGSGATGAATADPSNNGRLGESPITPVTPTELLERNQVNKDAHTVDAIYNKVPLDSQTTQQHTRDSMVKKIMDKLIDSQAAFLDWTRRANLDKLNNGVNEFDSAPVWSELKAIPGKASFEESQLVDAVYKPIVDIINKMSRQSGIDPDIVAVHVGTYATFNHIPEANAALRRRYQNRIDELAFTGTGEELSAAQAQLAAFDEYQRTGQTPVPTAGGLINAQAEKGMRDILNFGYNEDDLRTATQSIVQAFQYVTNTLVERGVLLQEDVNSWKANNFQNYVALYVDQNPDRSDSYIGTNLLNPTEMHRRDGSLTHANHSIVTLRQAISRAAAQIAAQDFKLQLHYDFTSKQTDGQLAGMRRINIASPIYSDRLRQEPGILVTLRDPVEEDGVRVQRFKYYFDDPNVMKGLSFYAKEPDSKVMRGLSRVTNLQARLNTKYRVIFPMMNWFRDGWSRSTTLSSRYIYDSQGNLIPLTKIAPRLFLTTLNPYNVYVMARNMANGSMADHPLIQAFEDLKSRGGYSSYIHALDHSKQGFRQEIRKYTGMRKYWTYFDNAFGHWNEVFSAASAASAYKALIDLNVPAREAAARSLDVMNVHNRGMYGSYLRSFYPFVTPVFEGSRNFIRNIQSPRGRIVFGGMVLLGAGLYAALAGLAGDDDDYGNLLDAMSLRDMSRFIPVFMSDGSYARIPVPFESSRIAWIVGAGLNRLARGVGTPGDFISTLCTAIAEETQPADIPENDLADNVVLNTLMAAVPQAFRPLVEVGLNRSTFGTRLHEDTKNPEDLAASRGRARIPTAWRTLAETMSSATGGVVDMYPESYRHLAQSYLSGPLSGIVTALEANSQYTQGGELTTRQEIGWLADSVGLASTWNNGSGAYRRVYYNYQDKAVDILRRYGVSRTDPNNAPGERAINAARKILTAGGTAEEAEVVRLALEVDTELNSINRKLNDEFKQFRRSGLDLSLMESTYQVYTQKQESAMRGFINQTSRLLHDH